MIEIAVLVVNINNLAYTRNVINDLLIQDCEFKLTVVDQGSTEINTREYLDFLCELDRVNVIRNKTNVNLNTLWNKFYYGTKEPYLCFLNNDVRVPRNFLKDTLDIFGKEEDVGATIHATNHPNYQKTSNLRYVIFKGGIVQGWDFTIRREDYTMIPDDLKVFGGDDWLFVQMYRKARKVAMILSSPIIHYNARSRRYYNGNRREEINALMKHGIERLSYVSKYTKRNPRFEKIVEEEI